MTEETKEILHGPHPTYKTILGPHSHFCPGCHYGIIVRCLIEALEKTDALKDMVMITGIGCSMVTMHYVTGMSGLVSLHGRAPAVATGMKRVLGKDKLVLTVQGDGDCSAIGMAEIMNAAQRYEKLTTIFLNNMNFGTTGGQMAPTTLVGMKTATTPEGRDAETQGFPIHMAEVMAQMKGVVYSYRGAVNSMKNFNKTKKALITGINNQKEEKGYSFIEILSACPPNQRIKPKDGTIFVEETMAKEFPLGEIKNVDRPL
jgi:2-oxoglutarate/2-oxoacid ferredoxin oxidoreductase subunit beta